MEGLETWESAKMKAMRSLARTVNVILVVLGCVWCLQHAWSLLQAEGRKRAPPIEPELRLRLAEAHMVGAALVIYAERNAGRLPLTLTELQPSYLPAVINPTNYLLKRPGETYQPTGFGIVATDARGYWRHGRRANILIWGPDSVLVSGD